MSIVAMMPPETRKSRVESLHELWADNVAKARLLPFLRAAVAIANHDQSLAMQFMASQRPAIQTRPQ